MSQPDRMTETELTTAIGRAFTDILDAVLSHTARQVTLAVTPRAATGEPCQPAGQITIAEIHDALKRGGVQPITSVLLTGLHERLNQLTARTQPEPDDGAITRICQLENLAAEILSRFTSSSPLPDRRAWASEQEFDHWQGILLDATRRCMQCGRLTRMPTIPCPTCPDA